jgi:hypothetical protein
VQVHSKVPVLGHSKVLVLVRSKARVQARSKVLVLVHSIQELDHNILNHGYTAFGTDTLSSHEVS